MGKLGTGAILGIAGAALAIAGTVVNHIKGNVDAKAADEKNTKHLDELFDNYVATKEQN